MSVEVVLDTPLAEALNSAIQPKLLEVGWSTGGVDDSALSEYIILMLVNGKTQDQIAAELSGDLLNLGPDDPGARDFSQWLFQQVEYLSRVQQGSLSAHPPLEPGQERSSAPPAGQDAEMGDVNDAGESMVPTGPKSMRNGLNRNRERRMFGQMEKAMDRSMDRSQDAALHRVRLHGGHERINTHTRGMPTGPRAAQGRAGRSPMIRAMGGGQGMGNFGGAPPPGLLMGPSQQMELARMLEEQARMMAQMQQQQQQLLMTNGGQAQMMNMGMGHMFPRQHQQSNGRSLFDRVQPNPQGHNNAGLKRGPQSNTGPKPNAQAEQNKPSSSAMDVELTPAPERPSADTLCKFNLSCTNKDCIFAHQSPAAPPGTAVDVSDVCSFGAACKNRKCTGRHPSPAQRGAHQTEQDCKYFPNCTNPRCPFRHPTMPICRNGADCTTPNCKFTHVKTMCRFNPCLNPTCSFKHEEGQKRGKFDDKVWVAGENEHVSERKFVDENDGVEDLIVPGNSDGVNAEGLVT